MSITHRRQPACTFSACHGKTAIAGLDLLAADLHAELMNHDVVTATDLPLVTPGDPDNRWLYQVLSRCDPELPAANLAVGRRAADVSRGAGQIRARVVLRVTQTRGRGAVVEDRPGGEFVAVADAPWRLNSWSYGRASRDLTARSGCF